MERGGVLKYEELDTSPGTITELSARQTTRRTATLSSWLGGVGDGDEPAGSDDETPTQHTQTQTQSQTARPSQPRDPTSDEVWTTRLRWMKDEVCASCYGCQTSFTAFVRRHHCRSCGQVFCAKCCPKVVLETNGSISVGSGGGSNAGLQAIMNQISQQMLPPEQQQSRLCAYCKKHRRTPSSTSMSMSSSSLTLLPDATLSSSLSPQSPSPAVVAAATVSSAQNTSSLNLAASSSLSSSPSESGARQCPAIELPSAVYDTKEKRDAAIKAAERQWLAHDAVLWADSHSRLLGLITSMVSSKNLDPSWSTVIFRLAAAASRNVMPSPNDAIKDAREYVRVKVVPGGDASECRYYEALSFSRKHVIHRKMACRFREPRLLLLSCSVEFLRDSRLLSVDELLAQESAYLKLLVDRIAADKPDVVFTAGIVSRLAVDFFLRAGITVFSNVKPRLMLRLARYTSAEILSSLTLVKGEGKPQPYMGRCHSISVVDYETDSSCGSTKTVFFLEGAPRLGGTAILRGALPPVLEEVKRVLKAAIFAAHTLRTENSFLAESSLRPEYDSTGGHGHKDGLRHPPQAIHQSLEVVHALAPREYESGYQCVSYEKVRMDYYSNRERCLGQFLEQCCFDPLQRCPNMHCQIPLLEHERSFLLAGGRLNVTVDNCDASANVKAAIAAMGVPDTLLVPQLGPAQIYHFEWCRTCGRKSHFVPLSSDSWFLSFGKFLEIVFLEEGPLLCAVCDHPRTHRITCFTRGKHIAQFEYKLLPRFSVNTPEVHPPLLESLSAKTQSFLGKLAEELAASASSSFDALERLLMTYCRVEEISDEATLEQAAAFRDGLVSDRERITRAIQGLGRTGVFEVAALRVELRELHLSWAQRIKDTWAVPVASIPQESKGGIRALFKRSRSAVPPSSSVARSVPRPGTSLRPTELLAATPSPAPAFPVSTTPVPATLLPSSVPPPSDSIAIGDVASNFGSPTIGGLARTFTATQLPIPTVPLTSSSSSVSATAGTSFEPREGELFMPPGPRGYPIIVYEGEPASAIAYAMSSHKYADKFTRGVYDTSMRVANKELIDQLAPGMSLGSQVFDDSGNRSDPVITEDSASAEESARDSASATADFTDEQSREALIEMLKSDLRSDITIDMVNKSEGSKYDISCTAYYAKQFYSLRRLCWNTVQTDEHFIHSICRCRGWNTSGGKSHARFEKSWDDRFVLKQMPGVELTGFLENARKYFRYFARVIEESTDSQLAKIYGMYTVRLKTATASYRYSFLVMENLFLNREIKQVYDLKGALRGRFAQGGILLDGNLVKSLHVSPLCVSAASKKKTTTSAQNDTRFLASSELMDYSLLVGVDTTDNVLVTGIIDYIRQYTWDKQVESLVKTRAYNTKPTVISPEEYRSRFCSAMVRYFVEVPDADSAPVPISNSP